MTDRKDRAADMDLDALFAQARSTPPEPGADFLDTLVQQSRAEQPEPAAPRPAVRTRSEPIWTSITRALGGWAGMAGLVSTCAVGIWVGVNPPESLGTSLGLSELALETFELDPLTTQDLDWIEG